MNEPLVTVVGGINVDICGKAFAPLIAADSNPGRVSLSLGGVGRNIAHNLCLLQVPTAMLTAIGGDAFEPRIRSGCAAAGIDLSRALRVPEGRASVYLVIEGPEGDMALALCDAELAQAVTPDYLRRNLDLLNASRIVVLDANLSEQAIAFLAQNVTAPLFADTVSVTKAARLRPVLSRLHTLKPNRLEAELLSGVSITGPETLEQAARRLLEAGLQRVCISLGAEGVYCAAGSERCLVPCPPTGLVNASGGGDAMMAGFVRAQLDGLPLEQAAAFALACSSIAVEGERTINPALSLRSARMRAAGGGPSTACPADGRP